MIKKIKIKESKFKLASNDLKENGMKQGQAIDRNTFSRTILII